MSYLGFEPKGVIALLTDFGYLDPYVGVVKGRILQSLDDLGINLPYPSFIDLTHEIPPQDVKKAALCLKFAYKYFPWGTIFLAIVDPGVGTERRAILLLNKKYAFIGPDNGIFTFILRENPEIEVFEILKDKVLVPPYSSTFHGRDLFAPAVARLFKRGFLTDWTKPIPKNSLNILNFSFPERTAKGYRLSIWYVDRFGNLITNFEKGFSSGPFRVRVGDQEVRLVNTYAEGREGELIALFGSEGFLEIAIKNGSAFEKIGLSEIYLEFK